MLESQPHSLLPHPTQRLGCVQSILNKVDASLAPVKELPAQWQRHTGAIETETACSIWLSDSGCHAKEETATRIPWGVARVPLRRGHRKELPPESAVVET